MRDGRAGLSVEAPNRFPFPRSPATSSPIPGDVMAGEGNHEPTASAAGRKEDAVTAPRGRGPRPGEPGLRPGEPGPSRPLERSSATVLIYLRQLPRWLPPLALAGLLVAGLAVPRWGAIALLVVAAFLSWLAALSWPALASQGRLLRVAAIGCLLALAVVQAAR